MRARLSDVRLHHLALGTPDVERLAQFYRDVLGLPELKRHVEPSGGVRSIWLDLGGSILMLEHTQAAPRRVDGIGSGLFLLALRVSVAERLRLEQALESVGLQLESRTEFTSYARDPDGNRLALSHYPQSAPRQK